MTNLPTSGQGNSLDNFNVDRADYRQGMQNLLAFLAEGLGGVPVGTFTTQAVDPAQVHAALGWARTGTTIAPKTAGDVVAFSGGTPATPGLAVVGDPNTGIYSPGADQLAISTNGVERVKVGANGSVAISSPLYPNCGLRVAIPMTTAGSEYGIAYSGDITAGVTSATGYLSSMGISSAAVGPVSAVTHYWAQQGSITAGSSIAKQYGFIADLSLVGAATNYGFYSAVPAGANRYNFYSAGDADSYFASNNFIFANGGTERARFDPNGKLLIGKSVATLGAGYVIETNESISIGAGTAAAPALAFAGDPNTGIYSPGADQLAIGTNGVGHFVIGSIGNVGVGGSADPNAILQIKAPLNTAGAAYGVFVSSTINRSAIDVVSCYATSAVTEPASFTVKQLFHYQATSRPFIAGSAVTNQYGFQASEALVGATNNYAFYSNIQNGAGRWSFYAAQGADSYFASHNFIFANGGTERARFDATGKLLLGRSTALAGSNAQLQATGTLNVTTAVHADNTAAKAAGLVAGDIYRKADGTLMITF